MGGGLGNAHRQMREGREPIPGAGDLARDLIVEITGECDCLVAVQHVCASDLMVPASTTCMGMPLRSMSAVGRAEIDASPGLRITDGMSASSRTLV